MLRTMAARGGEHGMSFAKRVNELGFAVRERDDQGLEERASIASSSEVTDIEKFEGFGLHELEKVLCYFDDVFKDHSIDIRTGELLGRYIAEQFGSCLSAAAVLRQPGGGGGEQRDDRGVGLTGGRRGLRPRARPAHSSSACRAQAGRWRALKARKPSATSGPARLRSIDMRS